MSTGIDCKIIARWLTKRLNCPLCCGNKECEYANTVAIVQLCLALSQISFHDGNNDPAHRCADCIRVSYVYRYMSHDGWFENPQFNLWSLIQLVPFIPLKLCFNWNSWKSLPSINWWRNDIMISPRVFRRTFVV